MQSSPNSTPMFSDKLDLPNVSSGILDIPEGQELVFEGGVPYLRKNTRQVKNIKHKQPLSFGLSVRKALPKNFSVETGVTYTMLSSEITYENSSEKQIRNCTISVFRCVRTGVSLMTNVSQCMYLLVVQ